MTMPNTCTHNLGGAWKLSYGPQGAERARTPAELTRLNWPEIPALVPGNVELDLQRAGVLPDIMTGDSIYELRPFEAYQWWYRREFASPRLRPGERAELVFEGIDCLAAVFLNGTCIGEPQNMLIAHRYDITGQLHTDGRANELVVRIDSAVLAGRARQPEACEGAAGINWESLAIRKAPHMYGWDIMPRVVSAGLWRGVRIDILPPTRFADCAILTPELDVAAKRARVVVDWHLITDRFDLDDCQIHMVIGRQGRTCHDATAPLQGNHGRLTAHLHDVEFWWPHGYGEAALYELVLTLRDGDGQLLASHTETFGIRTVRLLRSDVTTPEKPGEFVFVVNGEKIFIKGTNWVPLDALHSRDPEHLATTIAMAVELNCNMFRCWGGNVYEDHAFFDACDRHGILVWQDFAFACALYPQDDAFAAAVAAEAAAIVRKLRNHPSLALWAGNNEGDMAYSGWFGWGADPGADRISRQVLPEAVRRHDPSRDYLPSSPYHSPEWLRQGAVDRLSPEDHLWGPRDDFKSEFYTGSPAHFASEIGYHGCPDRTTLEAMLGKEHLWPWQDNDRWLTYAVRPLRSCDGYNYRIPLMATQAALLFGETPVELDDFILASQISQAEALKFFVERFRLDKWRRTGLLWWNLRDGWPIISDAVVDYYNRHKLAYGYLKRIQADVCAMCGEAMNGQHALVVANDTRRAVSGQLTVCDLDSGRALWTGPFAVTPNGKSELGAIPAASTAQMWRLDWRLTDAGTTGLNHYLAGPRPFTLAAFRRWLPQLNRTE